MSDKGKRPEKPRASLAEQMAALKGPASPAPTQRERESEPRRFSARVTNPERAGRAPYNFVPLPDSIHWIEEVPPAHDHYGDGLLSGEIELEITALTDFYCRGMWP